MASAVCRAIHHSFGVCFSCRPSSVISTQDRVFGVRPHTRTRRRAPSRTAGQPQCPTDTSASEIPALRDRPSYMAHALCGEDAWAKSTDGFATMRPDRGLGPLLTHNNSSARCASAKEVVSIRTQLRSSNRRNHPLHSDHRGQRHSRCTRTFRAVRTTTATWDGGWQCGES